MSDFIFDFRVGQKLFGIVNTERHKTFPKIRAFDDFEHESVVEFHRINELHQLAKVLSIKG